MDLQFGITITTTTRRKLYCSSPLKSHISASRDSNNNNSEENDKGTGDKSSADWDKAWSSFRKRGKKSFFSQFNPNKYVSWNPKRSDYPVSEEVDPIKRAERSNLMLWTSPRFTLAGAIVIVSFLLLYTILAPTR